MMMKAMSPGRLQPHLLGVAIACMTVGQAQAFEVDLGDSDFRLRWDNTVRYNWAMRLQDQSHLIDRAGGGALRQKPCDGPRWHELR